MTGGSTKKFNIMFIGDFSLNIKRYAQENLPRHTLINSTEVASDYHSALNKMMDKSKPIYNLAIIDRNIAGKHYLKPVHKIPLVPFLIYNNHQYISKKTYNNDVLLGYTDGATLQTNSFLNDQLVQYEELLTNNQENIKRLYRSPISHALKHKTYDFLAEINKKKLGHFAIIENNNGHNNIKLYRNIEQDNKRTTISKLLTYSLPNLERPRLKQDLIYFVNNIAPVFNAKPPNAHVAIQMNVIETLIEGKNNGAKRFSFHDKGQYTKNDKLDNSVGIIFTQNNRKKEHKSTIYYFEDGMQDFVATQLFKWAPIIGLKVPEMRKNKTNTEIIHDFIERALQEQAIFYKTAEYRQKAKPDKKIKGYTFIEIIFYKISNSTKKSIELFSKQIAFEGNTEKIDILESIDTATKEYNIYPTAYEIFKENSRLKNREYVTENKLEPFITTAIKKDIEKKIDKALTQMKEEGHLTYTTDKKTNSQNNPALLVKFANLNNRKKEKWIDYRNENYEEYAVKMFDKKAKKYGFFTSKHEQKKPRFNTVDVNTTSR